MKVVAREKGRVVVLADASELGEGRLRTVDLFAMAHEKYKFAVLPDLSKRKDAQEPLRFEFGFDPETGVNIPLFEIHPQGIVAEASATEDADKFLNGVFAWAAKELGLSVPDTAKRVYSSYLIVKFKNRLDAALVAHSGLQKLLTSALSDTYEIRVPAQISRLALRPDPELLTPRMSGLLVEFSIERRVFAPYEEEKFYSVAPLPTTLHIKLLEKLDQNLS